MYHRTAVYVIRMPGGLGRGREASPYPDWATISTKSRLSVG